MRKYCRICWNTRYWREPTGEAARIETGKSFVQKNRFGHEEWLFNFSWLQRVPTNADPTLWKYGFLQPINKYRSAYEGKTFDVLVYTVAPNGERIAVAAISDLHVPLAPELEQAITTIRDAGWLETMEEDLKGIGVSASALHGPASQVINVRFDPSNVAFFDPRLAFPRDHKVYRINRYQPIDWDDDFPFGTLPASRIPPRRTATDRRSEEQRQRAAVDGTTYSPRHVILQNALYDYLCKAHGSDAVHYERAYVDLAVERNGEITLYEIKIAPTAKGCIREALGQLLEYGVYPDSLRATKIVIVGDGAPTADDCKYLNCLRERFALPLGYQQWVWTRNELSREW
jgi:hypothetical protein